MRKFSLCIVIFTFLGLILMSFRESRNSIILVESVKLTVVVNAKGAPSNIDLSKLKGVLKGEQQRWKNGTKITLALMKTSTEIGTDMTKRIFGMTVRELNKYYLAKVFQGKMSSPEFFTSESDLIRFVSENDGAIGIVSSSKAKGIDIMNVDGKKSL